MHSPGVGSLLKLIEEKQLANLRLIQHDAMDVVEHMIAPDALAGIHVFFPDPWPKKRHHKRRLIQPPFVHLLASRLTPGGYIHLATDWQDYAEQMLRRVERRAAAGKHRRRIRAPPRPPPADKIRAARTEARASGCGTWSFGALRDSAAPVG